MFKNDFFYFKNFSTKKSSKKLEKCLQTQIVA